jgi:uncharacterized damage-inducible protein DinB
MPTRLDEIHDLFAYDRWADRRILDAVDALDAEAYGRALVSSFPSVRDTLVHALAARWVWLRRCTDTSPAGMPQGWQGMGFEALGAAWQEVDAELAAFLAGLAETDLDRTLAYRDTRGRDFAQPLWQVLRHVVNHATYHRGQLVTLLRQVGAEPPATDMVVYHRERA